MSDPFNPDPTLTYRDEVALREELDGERSRLDPSRFEAEAQAAGLKTLDRYDDYAPLQNPRRRLAEPAFVETPDTHCWEWQWGKNHKGYGRIWVEGKNRIAHRVMYELHVGPIPEGLVIDHLCCNKACVNPGHLEVVTVAENNRRGDFEVGRGTAQTHCIHGHEFTPENTILRKGGNGRRDCRTCQQAQVRRAGARKRAAAGAKPSGRSTMTCPVTEMPCRCTDDGWLCVAQTTRTDFSDFAPQSGEAASSLRGLSDSRSGGGTTMPPSGPEAEGEAA